MKTGTKILLGTTLTAIVVGTVFKGASFYNKIKQASGNVNFNVSFLRIHGLMGQGITKFVSPIIRVLFNLNLSNFSSFDIEVKNIYARVETQKAGSATWDVIAKATNYMSVAVKDGKEINKELIFDFKGLTTITSLTNKLNRHRIVLTYNYKGTQLQYESPLELATPISAFWSKARGAFNSLKGTENTNTLNLIG